MTAVFVLQPNRSPQVSALQDSMKQQFSIAWQETIGDQPWFEDVSFVYDSVSDFYSQATDATIALIGPQGNSDQDIYFVYRTVYHDFAQIIGGHITTLAQAEPAMPPMSKFMTEPAITNIIPVISGDVSGASMDAVEPVNKVNSWVTIQDNFTGQMYCLAIYNGEVNKYLGICKSDSYH